MNKKKDVEHSVDAYDLTYIYSVAVNSMQNIEADIDRRLDKDQQIALCYLESITGFLRKEGLIDFILRYEDK